MRRRSRKRYDGPPVPPPPQPHAGEVAGWITIVQEDRFRLMDDEGHGYLFVTRKRAASHEDLERWRDRRTPLAVRYYGVPDLGAVARKVEPVRPRPVSRLGAGSRTG